MISDLKQTEYGIGVELSGSFSHVIERVKEAFKAQGFGALTEIDIQGTLREKIGEEIEPYTLLGMCNPKLASRAIAAEHEIGLLLPCNVLVHQHGGKVRVSAQDPNTFTKLVANEAIGPIAAEAREGIERALQALRS